MTEKIAEDLKSGSISFMVYAYPQGTKMAGNDGGAAALKRKQDNESKKVEAVTDPRLNYPQLPGRSTKVQGVVDTPTASKEDKVTADVKPTSIVTAVEVTDKKESGCCTIY